MRPRRRAIHVVSESAALFVAVPFLLWASYQTPVALARIGLRLLAVSTVLVDGWLLSRWRRERRATRRLDSAA